MNTTKKDWFKLYAEFVLLIEQKYSNEEGDKGGETWWGLTHITLGSIGWDLSTPPSREQAIELYRKVYWEGWQCDKMHPFVAWCACDAYVQHHPQDAAILIQSGLGVLTDGIVGPKTLAAAKSPNLLLFWQRYRLARIRLYNKLVENDASQARFIDGWHERIHRLIEAMYFNDLLVRDGKGGLKTALTSSTAKAVGVGSVLGVIVGILQWMGIDTANWQQIALEAGVPSALVGLAATWIGKHKFKEGVNNE